MTRGGTNRENTCRVRYQVNKLQSGPAGFTWRWLAKLLNMFSLVWGNMPIGSHLINRAAIVRSCLLVAHQRLCIHRENDTLNMNWTDNPDIRTLALNWVGYLGSGFAHLLLDVCWSGVWSTTNIDNSLLRHFGCPKRPPVYGDISTWLVCRSKYVIPF